MAEIDKALPNVDETLTVSQEEIEQLPEPIQSGPQEMVTNEDGSVDINFEENQMAEMPQDHFANLADYMDDASLGRLGADLCEKYDDYKNSRKDWEQAYITGLDLLGFKYNMRSEPFQGASGATHPVLAEAVTQFQALAYKEFYPRKDP